jgi:hypothetical protein
MAIEPRRGCGFRRVGGIYLISLGGGRGCGRRSGPWSGPRIGTGGGCASTRAKCRSTPPSWSQRSRAAAVPVQPGVCARVPATACLPRPMRARCPEFWGEPEM